jgi:hypothetical protein
MVYYFKEYVVEISLLFGLFALVGGIVTTADLLLHPTDDPYVSVCEDKFSGLAIVDRSGRLQYCARYFYEMKQAD